MSNKKIITASILNSKNSILWCYLKYIKYVYKNSILLKYYEAP